MGKIELTSRDRDRPSTITLSGLTRLAFLLILFVLEEPPPFTLLNDAGSHDFSSKPVQESLFRLVVVDDDLDIVSRFEEKGVGVSERRAYD